MPQNRTAPPAPRERTETEWRSEQQGYDYWGVFDGPLLIAGGLTEQQARLIAAAPAKERLCEELQHLVDQQAEDEGLWFQAATAPEAYLQQELRKLHAAIEAEKELR